MKTFGRLESKRKREANSFYKNGAFRNLEATSMMAPGTSYFKLLRKFFSGGENRQPSEKFIFEKSDLKSLKNDTISIVWFGHSSYLLNAYGLLVLVDPVLGGSASPFKFMVKAFEGADIYTSEDFPEIDVLLITHDHYDHLDHRFIEAIRPKIKKVVCSYGVGAHLRYWKYDSHKINELSWWETHVARNYKFTALPARHFSGRFLKRNQSLWSAFALEIAGKQLFLGGDSGYGSHFVDIGNRVGPFDLAILECGQYNTTWPMIHMMPEETVKAAKDLRAEVLMPVHWGKFNLALHGWREPAERVSAAAKEQGQKIVMPAIGQVYELGHTLENNWWKKYGKT